MDKLINEKTGLEIKIGEMVETFRGERVELISFQAGRHAGSTGRVVVALSPSCEAEYYPGVIGAKIVKDAQ